MRDSLVALWAYRGFVLASVQREFRTRYLNSLLGAAWSVLGPLAMIVVYTVIFSQVMRSRLPGMDTTTYAYSIYLWAGLLAWNLFSEVVTNSVSVFVDNANLLKKLNFPRLCLPAVVVLNALVNFAIAFLLFVVFLIFFHHLPWWVLGYLLPLIMLVVAFAVSLGLLLGMLNVFFRDVGHLVRIGLQFWFWLTPVVYTVSMLPEAFRSWIDLNPLASLISGFQGVLLYGLEPTWVTLWPLMLLTLLLMVLTRHLYLRLSAELVDEL